jgi:hypothetical protein
MNTDKNTNTQACHPERSEGSRSMSAGVYGAGFFTSFRMTDRLDIVFHPRPSAQSAAKN